MAAAGRVGREALVVRRDLGLREAGRRQVLVPRQGSDRRKILGRRRKVSDWRAMESGGRRVGVAVEDRETDERVAADGGLVAGRAA